MNTVKLTLSIPERVLVEAKAYSRRVGEPLSRLVSRYFTLLSRQEGTGSSIASCVRRVTGIVRSSKTAKELLSEAFEEKYHLRSSR